MGVRLADGGCLHPQESAPSGYVPNLATAEGRAVEARAPEAASRYSVEVPAYAPAGARSAAAEFVERSDPPKIRVVVRKRPLNQKARGSGCTACLEREQVCSKGLSP